MIPILALALCLCQPENAETASAPRAPSVDPSRHGEIDPVEFVRRVRARYRVAEIHETYEIEVSHNEPERIRAEVKCRSRKGDGGVRALLEFGPFSLLIEPSRLALIHRFNRKAALVLEGSPAMELLEQAIPPLPIPQLPLIVQPAREDSPDFDEITGLGPWFDSIVVEGVRMEGESMIADCRVRDGNRVTIETDSEFRIRRFESEIASNGEHGRLTISSVENEVQEIPTWDQFVGDRTLVADVAELRALPALIRVGDRLPELGMLTDQLQPWSFDETIAGAVALAPASRQFIAVVFYDCASDASREDAVIAMRALQETSRRLRRAAALGTGPMVRLTPVVAGAFALRSLSTDELSAERERWPELADSQLIDVGFSFAWVPAGADPVSRFAPDARCVAVVVDGQRRVVAMIPIDGRTRDIEGLTIDVLGVVK